MRTFAAVTLLLGSLCCFASNDPQQIVAKVHTPPLMLFGVKSGTAWCLDSDCQWMVTNYHVLRGIGTHHLVVNGERVQAAFAATGPSDDGARAIPGMAKGNFKYTWGRDLALLKMETPMSRHGMHGVTLFLGKLEPGEPVTVLSYPAGKFVMTEGRFDAIKEQGILKFDLSTALAPGSSGGLILNKNHEAVGVLFALDLLTRRCAYAVPIWSLADFVKKTDAKTYATLFPHDVFRPDSSEAMVGDATVDPEREGQGPLADDSGSLNPVAVLPVNALGNFDSFVPPGHTTVALAPEQEQPEVKVLRTKVAQLGQQMTNFIATQTITHPDTSVWTHQVRVVDGEQVFVKADGTQLKQVKIPRVGVVPGSQWLELPLMLSDHQRSILHYMGDRLEGTSKIRVFAYRAVAASDLCQMRVKKFLHGLWEGPSVACYGEVWTDPEYNVLRISEMMALPKQSGLDCAFIVVLYGRIKPPLFPERLVPASMRLSTLSGSGLIQSSAIFSSYRLFAATSKIFVVNVTTKIIPN